MAGSAYQHGVLANSTDRVSVNCEGLTGVAVQVLGTWTGTIQFQGTAETVNYTALNGLSATSQTPASTTTGNGLFFLPCAGLSAVSVHFSSFGSGAAYIAIRAVGGAMPSFASGSGGGGGTSSNFGDPFPVAGTAAGFIDGSGNMAGGTLDASGFLKVNVAAGSSGNSAASATGSAVPADADYLGVNDPATGNLTGVSATALDYDTGAGTKAQTMFGLALPASGGPVAGGTSTNPVRVDPTGTTTQPVSASALPLPTGAATESTLSTLNGKVTACNTGAVVVSSSALPSGASTAAKQPALGTAGTASADVITIQGITSMTPLLVTPAANSSVNLAQVAGASVATGHGTASGAVRVELPTDGTGVVGLNAGTNLVGQVSSSLETSTIYNGTTALTPKFVAIAASSSGNNTLVSAVNPKKIRVLAYTFIANGTVNAKFQSGASGTDLTGLKYCVANMGLVAPFNPVGWFETASNTLLNLNLSAGVAVGGELVYVEV